MYQCVTRLLERMLQNGLEPSHIRGSSLRGPNRCHLFEKCMKESLGEPLKITLFVVKIYSQSSQQYDILVLTNQGWCNK